MIAGLTLQQVKLMRFIQSYIDRSGASPSFREMQFHLGVASISNVHRLMAQLRERGHVDFHPRTARSVVILKRIEAAPKPSAMPPIDYTALDDKALIGIRASVDYELKRRREAA